MRVEIWSDIACPWCYIGRRRFEKALKQFEHSSEVEIIWRSFELDPNAPREYPGSVNDMLVEKKGISRPQAEAMHKHVTDLAAQEGLDYHFELARVGNSFDAHRLLHLAAKRGLQGEMKERIQKGYFTEGLAFSDVETLVKLAVEVGLDGDEARQVLESDAYADDVRADEQKAYMIGVRGVPFFLFDEKYAVSGAQPSDLFMTALQRTWAESHPVVQLVSDNGDAGVCDDESCTV
jgi:predicted DsbA family dithiol-disulfide isomerase